MKHMYQYAIAPVHLTNCFFPIVVFEANPEFGKTERDEPPHLNVSITDIRFESIKDDPDQFAAFMTVRLEWPDEETPPYKNAMVQVGGFFKFVPGVPDELKNRHKGMSAPSMLYSSARDWIKHITQNGPWGSFILPGMLFLENSDAGFAEKTDKV